MILTVTNGYLLKNPRTEHERELIRIHLCFGFLGLQFLEVEVEFFAFQDVTIGSSALTWSAVDFSQNFTLKELTVQVSSDIRSLLPNGVLLFGGWSAVINVVDSFGFFFSELVVLLSAESLGVVRLIKNVRICKKT